MDIILIHVHVFLFRLVLNLAININISKMSTDQQDQLPLSTVIRIRRKRTAPPSTEWVVASKKTRADDGDADNLNPSAFFKLTATADKPSIDALSGVNHPVAVVEYDLVNGILNKKVVDKEQEQVNEAVELVEKMDVSENDLKNKAPLASNESLNGEYLPICFFHK